MKPKVAFIGTGGTIGSLGKDTLDIIDYASNGAKLEAEEILARFPETATVAQVIPVSFRAVPSFDIGFAEWKEIIGLCDKLVADHPDLAGIVLSHGTASLEETAFFLNLTIKVKIPVVVVGSQRPANGLSSDAGLNLVNAIRVAADPASRGLGVLVMLNDEIQAARDVTKTSTFRLQTFRTPDFGILGQVDGEEVSYYRAPLRRRAPDTEFDVRTLDVLPRVDISYAYVGSDGAAVRAFLEAGAVGIVGAGFGAGYPGSAEVALLHEASTRGVVVMLSTRVGSGRAHAGRKQRDAGFLTADTLNPQKARLLLALALTVTKDKAEIARIFARY